MYYKGGNMLHTIRQVVGNDSVWRATLRGLQRDVRAPDRDRPPGAGVHQRARRRRPGARCSSSTSRRRRFRCFEYRLDGTTLAYRWANVVAGFDMPVRVAVSPDSAVRLTPTEHWQTHGRLRSRRRSTSTWTRTSSSSRSGSSRPAPAADGDGAMIGPTDADAHSQPLIVAAGVDGWLLFDFRGRNPIAAAVLGDEIVGSRRVYVLIPPTVRRRRWSTRSTPSSGAAGLPRGPSGSGSRASSSRGSSARWCAAGGSPWTTRPTAPSLTSTASPPAWRSCFGASAPRWSRRRIW